MGSLAVNTGGWEKCRTDLFWGEIATHDHVLQVYEKDDDLLDTLSAFVGDGINAGDACIVIATQVHLKALEKRLADHGIQVKLLVSECRYIPLDAGKMLAQFMIDGWPDEQLFFRAILHEMDKIPAGRKIRAFGEMVALLWNTGNKRATVQLECLWNKFAEQRNFCLFCAYPKSGFSDSMDNAAMHVCCSHSKVVEGTNRQLTEIRYRDIVASS